jgi:hypothetical protein
MIEYSNALVFVTSPADIAQRLANVRLIIAKLYVLAANSSDADNGIYESYELDDGQVKIATKYRSSKQINNDILAYERLENKYLKQLNGRRIVLRDGKNFRKTTR